MSNLGSKAIALANRGRSRSARIFITNPLSDSLPTDGGWFTHGSPAAVAWLQDAAERWFGRNWMRSSPHLNKEAIVRAGYTFIGRQISLPTRGCDPDGDDVARSR